MSKSHGWFVEVVEVGHPVPFGPAGGKMPNVIRGHVRPPGERLRLTLSCSFAGDDRVRVLEACVTPDDGVASLTPSDFTRLKLAQAVHQLVTTAANERFARRLDRTPTPEELRRIAHAYWFHYITWGDPRQAVMTLWGLKRSTANRWLRMTRELYPLPGPHSD